jgi:hypothetical protein
MADGDGAIILQDGRSGGWYTYNDNTGTQTPAAPQVAAGQGQICTSGFGFIDWGAGLGVSLDADATKSCDYDGSIYKGISFWIEGVAVGGEVRFTVQTSNIASSNAGGTCVASGTTNDCDDTYGANLVSTTAGISCTTAVMSWTCGPLTGTTGPIAVSIPFLNMSQEGWGRPIPNFDRTRMLGLQWQFKLNTSFNICLHNVSFF